MPHALHMIQIVGTLSATRLCAPNSVFSTSKGLSSGYGYYIHTHTLTLYMWHDLAAKEIPELKLHELRRLQTINGTGFVLSGLRLIGRPWHLRQPLALRILYS